MKSTRKESKSCLIDGVIISLVALFMGGIGLAVAYFMFLDLDYEIPWDHYTLQGVPKEITSIEYVDIKSSLDDPTGDIVYVATEDGKTYANTLFENDWLLVEPVSTSENDHTSNCAPEWPDAPSNAPIWDPPPVTENVLDSAGVRFERPFSIIIRCYVLSDDGNLEVWIREDNASSMGLFEFVHYAQVFGCLGVIVGIIVGILLLRLKTKKQFAN